MDVIRRIVEVDVMRIREESSGLHWAARRDGSTVPTTSTWEVLVAVN